MQDLKSLSIDGLKNLEELWLGCNQVEEIISLDLPKLRILSLSCNQLKSIRGIGLCANLEECLIDNNHLTVIDELQCLSKLRIVDISGNEMTHISALYHLKLTDLWMSNNQLDAIKELLQIGHKDSLETVSFEGCNSPSASTCAKIICEKFRNVKKINGHNVR
jgi:Leucine-rich repeat (LRR) protein